MFGINDSLRQDADKFVMPDVFYKNYDELYDADWLSDRASDVCHFSPKGSRATAKYIFDDMLDFII